MNLALVFDKARTLCGRLRSGQGADQGCRQGRCRRRLQASAPAWQRRWRAAAALCAAIDQRPGGVPARRRPKPTALGPLWKWVSRDVRAPAAASGAIARCRRCSEREGGGGCSGPVGLWTRRAACTSGEMAAVAAAAALSFGAASRCDAMPGCGRAQRSGAGAGRSVCVQERLPSPVHALTCHSSC